MSLFDYLFKPANSINATGENNVYGEEYSKELYYKEFSNNVLPDSYAYTENGVQIQEAQDKLRIVYNGILAQNGASDIYAVVGYGNNKKWEDVKQYPMSNAGMQTFELLLPDNDNRNINVAFKDRVDNWDNNSGANYIFRS